MLYTAQYSYKGPERYDITSKVGGIFSPTWDMVRNYKDFGDEEEYTARYLSHMRESYIKHIELWKEMIVMCKRGDVVLVCYCKAGDFCHRVLLAEMLQKCGVTYKGEK